MKKQLFFAGIKKVKLVLRFKVSSQHRMLIKIKPEGKRKEKNVVSSVMTLNILLTFLAYLSDCFKRRQENTKK